MASAAWPRDSGRFGGDAEVEHPSSWSWTANWATISSTGVAASRASISRISSGSSSSSPPG